jgi:F-type H+-transporting ATPase subunit b
MKRSAQKLSRIAFHATIVAWTVLCALPAVALAAEEKKSSGLPQLDTSTYTSQVFWLAVAFLLLYAIVTTKVLPVISTTQDNRNEHIKNDTDSATKLKYDAEEARKTYDRLLEGARSEATRVLTNANDSIKNRAAEELQALREKGAKEAAALEKRIAKAKEDAKADISSMCAELASDISARITGDLVKNREAA